MLNTRINKVIDGLKISKQDRAEIDRLLNRPEVQNVLNADSQEQVDHRKTLIKELSSLPGQAKKFKADAAKNYLAANEQFTMARSAYIESMAVLNEAAIWNNNAGYTFEMRGSNIKRELVAGADARINEYRYEIGQIIGRLNMKLQFWHETSPKSWTGESNGPRHFSNVEDIARARFELDAAIVRLTDLTLEAMHGYEVTDILNGLSIVLKAPLAELDMHPPTLDDHGAVVAPRRDNTQLAVEQAA